MIDLQILKDHQLTDENLQKWLAGDPLMKAPERSMKPMNVPVPEGGQEDPAAKEAAMSDLEKRKCMINRIRSRIQEGQTRNMADYKVYHALDLAWDTCFRQINPTMVAQFLDSDPNDETVYKQMQNWGLSHLITSEKDSKGGKDIRKFNLPIFFNILVPLVKSYVTIRWAKIMNDRRLTPFFKYEPIKVTQILGLKCDVITDRVSIISNQYGYFDVMKQGVLKMLHYSTCFQFPETEWDFEEQWKIASDEDVQNGKTKANAEGKPVPVAKGDKIKVTVREGIKYHQPHPSRTFYDMAHPAYTFNYGYGCRFAGYWRIMRYSEILNGNYWNKNNIALGSVDLIGQNSIFFNTVYPCNMTYATCPKPPTATGASAGAEAGVGAGPLDRESQLATMYYGSNYGDQGVLVTEYFEKLVPKDNGLGTYDCPLWFRFVVAGDGCTVMYAAPLPYDPVLYYGYDADESRAKNASLSLEILPFQDQFSNVLTQIILTAKQNLANLVLVDEDQLTDKGKTYVQNMGESFFRFLNVIGFKSRQASRSQNRPADVAHSVNFPKGNTSELIGVLKTILDVLERVLVMSSNEVGQAASHEQTREEIKNISANTSSRLVFTSTPVDIVRDAWKRQLYQGLMAYGDDDIYASISSDLPLSQEVLTKMGFTFVDKDAVATTDGTGTNGYSSPRTKYRRVKTTKAATAIPLWEIASTRDGDDRLDREKLAVSFATILDKLLTNPITAPAIGAEQAIEWVNYISQLLGLPRDVKFKNMTPQGGQMSPEQQQANAQQELKQVIDAVLKVVNAEMTQEMKPLLDTTVQTRQDVDVIMQRLAQIIQVSGLQLPPLNDQPNAQAPQPAAS